MKKRITYGVLAVLLLASWLLFSNAGSKLAALNQQKEQIQETGDPEEKVPSLESDITTLEGERTFNGILLALLSAGVVGIVFVVEILPVIAQRLTHAVYDSGEEVEPDAMHEAHALLARGEYEAAIKAFKRAAETDPANRLPWVEIAKVQRTHLEDPAAAVATLKQALEIQEWPVDDAAFFLFRIAEIYHNDLADTDGAVSTVQQVVHRFPETRHAANARHKLHEWGVIA